MCSVSLHEARPIVLGSAAVHVALSVLATAVEVSFQAIADCNDRNGGPLHALVWHVRLRQWRRQSNASAQHFPILPIPWFFHWWALQPSHILGVHGDSASPTATWWACCDIAPRSPRHRASFRFSANMHSPVSGEPSWWRCGREVRVGVPMRNWQAWLRLLSWYDPPIYCRGTYARHLCLTALTLLNPVCTVTQWWKKCPWHRVEWGFTTFCFIGPGIFSSRFVWKGFMLTLI